MSASMSALMVSVVVACFLGCDSRRNRYDGGYSGGSSVTTASASSSVDEHEPIYDLWKAYGEYVQNDALGDSKYKDKVLRGPVRASRVASYQDHYTLELAGDWRICTLFDPEMRESLAKLDLKNPVVVVGRCVGLREGKVLLLGRCRIISNEPLASTPK
jgi:hypothetical protein